jgi:hypothetical protein
MAIGGERVVGAGPGRPPGERARAGAGRPMGARDKMPRRSRKTGEYPDTEASLRLESGRLLAENEQLRSALNYTTKFEGDSKALFIATHKGEYYPTQAQLYAAKAVLDREHPPATTVDGRSVEEIQQAVREKWMAEAGGATVAARTDRPCG